MAISKSNSKTFYCSAAPSSYPFTLSISFTESSTSTTGNTSTLSLTGKLKSDLIAFSTNYNNTLILYWHDNNKDMDVKVGSTKNVPSLGMSSSASVTGSITVSHKSDGSLSGYAKVVWTRHSSNASVGYCPPSTNVSTATTALTTIPRASSISALSGSALGSAVSVTISRASTAFTHKVEYSFAGSTYTTATSSATTSASFTPPLSLASNIPNATSGTLTVRVTTLSGSTQIGSAVTKTCTLSLPSSVVPTMSTPTATRVDGSVPTSWGVYVKGYSKATIAIVGAAGVYGSTIKSYSISGGGFSGKTSSLTTGILNTTGTITFTCIITDSRGRTASKTVSISVVDYTAPSISVTAKRCLSDKTLSTSGTYLLVTCTYSYASVSSKNTITRSVSCNSVSNTSFTSGTAFLLNANCVATSTYVLTASITDGLSNKSTATVTIPTDFRIFHIKANGKGFAFGKFAETDNLLESAWPIRTSSSIYTGGKTANTDGKAGVVVAASGYIELSSSTPYIDFHFGNSTNDYTSRIIESASGTLTINGVNIYSNTILASNWLRSSGDTGWYNQTYSGGIYMADTTWVRVFNGKKFYVANTETTAIHTAGGINPLKGVYLPNGIPLYGLNTSGTTHYQLIGLSSNDNIYIGSSTASESIGNTNIYAMAGMICLNASNGYRIGNSSGASKALYFGSAALYNNAFAIGRYWADQAAHEVVTMSSDGLTTGLGWAGSSSYATVTRLRGRTCQYQNASGTTSLSDANLKKDIAPLSENDKYDVFFDNLKPVEYKLILGSSGRPHFGYVTQDVESALEKAGMTTADFAGVNIMPIHGREQEENEHGDMVDIEDSPDNYLLDRGINEQHNLVYTEFIAINTMQIQKAKAEIKALKAEIKEIKEAINYGV